MTDAADRRPTSADGPDDLTQRILARLRDPGYRPRKVRPLARDMGIPEDDYGEFRRRVAEMMREGTLVEGKGRVVQLPTAGAAGRGGKGGGADGLTGKYIANPRGFGFVTLADAKPGEPDVFIPAGEARDALNGDTVLIRLKRGETGRGRASRAGFVVKVLARGVSRLVGTVLSAGNLTVFRPDGNKFPQDVLIADASAAGPDGVRHGDKAVVEIVKYPAGRHGAEGVVVELLGRKGEPGVDTLAILRQYEIPTEFPPEALADARAAAESFDESAYGGREDLRDDVLITIDPATARDFDDAVSVERRDDGGWELGVHIADVAHFVREGTALDAEARLRGNSVYLPRRVVPMLPEVLSNGVCSLQEGVDRLCKSVFIRLDPEGRPTGTRFSETVIRNRRRFTYEQITALLESRDPAARKSDGGRGAAAESAAEAEEAEGLDPAAKEDPEVVELVLRMDRLAKVLLERRRRDGMLELSLPVVELHYNEEARVIDASPENQDFSHRIIEMFMLEANEAVARRFAKLGIPTVRRVHEDPSEEAADSLRRFLKVLGFKLPADADRFVLQELLKQVGAGPEKFAVHLAVLRSMRKAVYSPELIGHYALASEDYLHFTSPIRRYPDLVVHRMLGQLLNGELRRRKPTAKAAGKATASRRGKADRDRRDEDGQHDERYESLAALSRHCSFTERRAEEAEEEYRTAKVLELLASNLGLELEGVITGVQGFGFFVQSTKFLIDGLVPIATLEDDFYDLHEDTGSLIGRRTRRVLRIGDPVRVRIASVDIPRRRLEFLLASTAENRVRRERAEARPHLGQLPRPARNIARGGPPRLGSGRGRDRRRDDGEGDDRGGGRRGRGRRGRGGGDDNGGGGRRGRRGRRR